MDDRPLPLMLASGSPYRRQLLERLGLPFECEAPDIDESAAEGEAPAATARRLSREKAEAVAARHARAVVIGSDQVAECDGRTFGKPGTHARALEQLRALRGRSARFHTGICLVDPRAAGPVCDVVTTVVAFRDADDDALERYLLAETPYDCAGSAKSEGLGIVLVERIDSTDPTALVGLPLIRLAAMLRGAGYALP